MQTGQKYTGDEGHCGLPTDELVPLAEKLLEVPQELIRPALNFELQEGAVVADRVGETPHGLGQRIGNASTNTDHRRFLADMFQNMVDVFQDQVGGRIRVATAVRPQVAGREGNAHQPLALANCGQLPVGEIARVVIAITRLLSSMSSQQERRTSLSLASLMNGLSMLTVRSGW
jgi:hypothetical protein